jgi:serine-type D-Ala-D-Ala endopeptidase (penicillin-binding protein 7)
LKTGRARPLQIADIGTKLLAAVLGTLILAVAGIRPASAAAIDSPALGGSSALRVTKHAQHAPRRDEPSLLSAAALVWDETDSAELFARHADTANPIASITKLMTAMVVVEGGQPLDEPLEITADDAKLVRWSSSRLGVGTVLTRGDMLHLALMSSENRAAHALARTYPGGVDAFVAAMNAKAKTLGMTNTHFVEPTGLSSDNVASPRDLTRLVIAASNNPTIEADSTTHRYAVSVRGKRIDFHTTDALVAEPTWDIVVQKTGYVSEAGHCLVLKALFKGRAIVIVLLNSKGLESRIADAQQIHYWMKSHLAGLAS